MACIKRDYSFRINAVKEIQETVQDQLSRYISELTDKNLDTDIDGSQFWSEQMTIYKLIGPLAQLS